MTVDLTPDELQALADEEPFLRAALDEIEARVVAATCEGRIPLQLLQQVDEARTRWELAERARVLLAERKP